MTVPLCSMSCLNGRSLHVVIRGPAKRLVAHPSSGHSTLAAEAPHNDPKYSGAPRSAIAERPRRFRLPVIESRADLGSPPASNLGAAAGLER